MTDFLMNDRLCEDLLEGDSIDEVRNLLENDEHLLQQAFAYFNAGQERMRDIFQAVLLIHACLQHTQSGKKMSVSEISVRALSGELHDSQTVEDMLVNVRTLGSEKLVELFESIPASVFNKTDLGSIQTDLRTLLETHSEDGPLRSEYNINSAVVKTTIVQQRIRLSKGKADLPAQDLEYTKLIDRLLAALQEYFAETLLAPQELFLNEAFLFDLRNPLKETFAPRPRFALERALISPFDYLISSSDTPDVKISARQPAAAILYQLYLESGALVNVHDLWQAFYAVFESDQGKKCDDRVVMTLFYSALADLKTFGMVKGSRKKADHLAKSSWMGL